MTLTIKDTPPVHPPIRRTIEGTAGDFDVRAHALSHYDPETGEYGPFELAETISLSRAGYIVLNAKAKEFSAIVEIVANITAAAVTTQEAAQ